MMSTTDHLYISRNKSQKSTWIESHLLIQDRFITMIWYKIHRYNLDQVSVVDRFDF